jgi:hypothetical protein
MANQINTDITLKGGIDALEAQVRGMLHQIRALRMVLDLYEFEDEEEEAPDVFEIEWGRDEDNHNVIYFKRLTETGDENDGDQ